MRAYGFIEFLYEAVAGIAQLLFERCGNYIDMECAVFYIQAVGI